MFEEILVQQNPHWSGQTYDAFIEREQTDRVLTKMRAKEILILYGIRRSGKSTLLKIIMNDLIRKNPPQSILYINLDDPYFVEIYSDPKQLYRLVEEAEKLTQHKISFLLLDEIQNIESWERFIKSVYDSEKFKKIALTGSNSTLLEGDYAKLLTGRYLKEKVFPLNFREMLIARNINNAVTLLQNKPIALKIIDEMMIYGCFPEVFKQTNFELKREILINYYDAIIFKDCISSNHIRDSKTFQELSHYLITNNTALYSYNGLSDIFNCSDSTVKQYISLLENCYLFNEIRPYSYSLKKQLKELKKIYLSDNGFFHAVAFQFKENHGKNFENLIFCELQKQGYDSIYYYLGDQECDFIIQLPKHKIAIQACYQIDERNIEREKKGAIRVMKEFNLKNTCIVTYNQELPPDQGIHILPFWKFFAQLHLYIS